MRRAPVDGKKEVSHLLADLGWLPRLRHAQAPDSQPPQDHGRGHRLGAGLSGAERALVANNLLLALSQAESFPPDTLQAIVEESVVGLGVMEVAGLIKAVDLPVPHVLGLLEGLFAGCLSRGEALQLLRCISTPHSWPLPRALASLAGAFKNLLARLDEGQSVDLTSAQGPRSLLKQCAKSMQQALPLPKEAGELLRKNLPSGGGSFLQRFESVTREWHFFHPTIHPLHAAEIASAVALRAPSQQDVDACLRAVRISDPSAIERNLVELEREGVPDAKKARRALRSVMKRRLHRTPQSPSGPMPDVRAESAQSPVAQALPDLKRPGQVARAKCAEPVSVATRLCEEAAVIVGLAKDTPLQRPGVFRDELARLKLSVPFQIELLSKQLLVETRNSAEHRQLRQWLQRLQSIARWAVAPDDGPARGEPAFTAPSPCAAESKRERGPSPSLSLEQLLGKERAAACLQPGPLRTARNMRSLYTEARSFALDPGKQEDGHAFVGGKATLQHLHVSKKHVSFKKSSAPGDSLLLKDQRGDYDARLAELPAYWDLRIDEHVAQFAFVTWMLGHPGTPGEIQQELLSGRQRLQG